MVDWLIDGRFALRNDDDDDTETLDNLIFNFRKNIPIRKRKSSSSSSSSFDDSDEDDDDSDEPIALYFDVFREADVYYFGIAQRDLQERGKNKAFVPVWKNFGYEQSYKIEQNDAWAVARNLLKALDEFGIKRTVSQIRLHKCMFAAILPTIFGDSFYNQYDDICKEFKLDNISQELIVISGRRSGKTTSVQIFAAACMIFVPDFIGLSFAMVKRTAMAMVTGIQNFIKVHPVGRYMNFEFTKEAIFYKNPSNSADSRQCQCLPGRSEVSGISAFRKNNFSFPSANRWIDSGSGNEWGKKLTINQSVK